MENPITIIKYTANDDLKLSMVPCCLNEAKVFIWSGRLFSIQSQSTFQPPLIATHYSDHAVEASTIPTPKPCYASMPLFMLYSLLISPTFEPSLSTW